MFAFRHASDEINNDVSIEMKRTRGDFFYVCVVGREVSARVGERFKIAHKFARGTRNLHVTLMGAACHLSGKLSEYT